MIAGTTAYVFDKTPLVSNTFVYDSSVFPDIPAPVPVPDPVIPDTGDHSSMALWSAILLLDACIGMSLYRRRAF